MDTEDGEFIICGSGGTPEDAAFDHLVGCIEDFMINYDVTGTLLALAPLRTIDGDHDRYIVFKQFVEKVEHLLDEHVKHECDSIQCMEEAGQLLLARREEISDEVFEFISEGCFTYETFLERWKEVNP